MLLRTLLFLILGAFPLGSAWAQAAPRNIELATTSLEPISAAAQPSWDVIAKNCATYFNREYAGEMGRTGGAVRYKYPSYTFTTTLERREVDGKTWCVVGYKFRNERHEGPVVPLEALFDGQAAIWLPRHLPHWMKIGARALHIPQANGDVLVRTRYCPTREARDCEEWDGKLSPK